MRMTLSFLLVLAGCAQFPALDGRITDAARQAPYPTLQPLPDFGPTTGTSDSAFDARVAALQARAARLRQMDIAALQ